MNQTFWLFLLVLLQASCAPELNTAANKCGAKKNVQTLNKAQKLALSDLQSRNRAQCAIRDMRCEYIVSEKDGNIRVYGYYAKVDSSSPNCATVSMDFGAHEYDINGKHVKELPLVRT